MLRFNASAVPFDLLFFPANCPRQHEPLPSIRDTPVISEMSGPVHHDANNDAFETVEEYGRTFIRSKSRY